MRPTTLAALLLILPIPSLAAWGEKSRACPRWETRLSQLETAGADANTLRRLRDRIASRCVAVNEIQVLGTHNSYHLRPRPALFNLLLIFDPSFQAWDYQHIPLDEQFSTQGIRQIELDVFADPMGGLYDIRHALILVGDPTDSGLPEMEQPGFKVLHIQDVDFETTCTTFVGCLKVVKA